MRTGLKNQQCPQCRKWFKHLKMHIRCSAQCKQVSINLHIPESPMSSIPLAEPRSVALHGHTLQQHNNSNCCPPSFDFLNPFSCPTSAEEWVKVDQDMARLVVPAVLAATSVEEKNQLLCNGIYNYFSSKYGTRAKGKRRTVQRPKKPNTLQNSLVQLWKEKNNLRNELRHAKKLGLNADSIRSLASKFHLLLRQYKRTNRSLCKSVSNNTAEYDRKECAKHFNRFAAIVLDGDDNLLSAEPEFNAATAESYFHKVYHTEPETTVTAGCSTTSATIQ